MTDYYYLKEGDVIQEGDEYHSSQGWCDSGRTGQFVSKNSAEDVRYRRRIQPAQSDAVEPKPTPSYYLRHVELTDNDKERGFISLDLYRVARIYGLNDPALFQAFKKILCAGQRGAKDQRQDVTEARDAAQRWLDLDNAK